jgi:hypothetical protein
MELLRSTAQARRQSGEALEVLGPEVLELEEISELLSGALGDHHAVRLGNRLETCGEVRRLADDAALLGFAGSDQVADHDQAGCNADAGLQRSAGLEPGHRRDQLQPSPYGPLGVILVGLGIAKIHEDAVAHVFRHEPVEATHDLGERRTSDTPK